MKYQELKEPCKTAILKGLCNGCVGLAEEGWREPEKCPYMPTAQDSIEQIRIILGVDKNARNNRR